MTDPLVRLTALRADTVARIAGLTRDVEDVIASASSTTGDDEHDPEGATIGFERAQAQALLGAAHAQLAAVDAALARAVAGTYGTCEVCGGPIGAERLDARPAATRCIRHA